MAHEIVAKDGRAHAATIDTTDDGAVNEYIDGIVKQTDKIDIILDAARPLAKIMKTKACCGLADRPVHGAIETMVKSRFITARAAARRIFKQRSGVIIFRDW